MIKRHTIYFAKSKDNKNIENTDSIKLGILKDILYEGYHKNRLKLKEVPKLLKYVKELEFSIGVDTHVEYGQYKNVIEVRVI